MKTQEITFIRPITQEPELQKPNNKNEIINKLKGIVNTQNKVFNQQSFDYKNYFEQTQEPLLSPPMVMKLKIKLPECPSQRPSEQTIKKNVLLAPTAWHQPREKHFQPNF